MSIQPQYYDEEFGYINEIKVGQQHAYGPEITIETVHGREVKLEPASPAYKRATKFLNSTKFL